MSDQVTHTLDDGIAVLTIDDGKANAISHSILDGLEGALDELEGRARALVLVGREGKFSAGFDLAAMTESDESMRALVIRGAHFLLRVYGLELPTVAACTGHALAAGALMLLVCDRRVGAEGNAKIGLNEVAIGMALPVFAVELARERITRTEFAAATMGAHIYDPAGAAAAGYLDRVVPADRVVETALAEARDLAQLRTGAYGRTKRVARQAVIDAVLATLAQDMAGVHVPTKG